MRRSVVVLLCLAVIVGLTAGAQDAACGLPTHGWETAVPEAVGLDGARLESSETTVEDELPFVRSVLVIRHGCLAYEQYYGDVDADEAVNVFSVTKSVTATLVGIALTEDAIGSVHDSIADYLDLEADNPRAAITVRHLLWMLSGLGWEEGRLAHIGGMLAGTRDEVGFILGLPLDHVPGTTWNYSTADSHLLSAILTAVTGVPTSDFAAEKLFGPLGIVPEEWQADSDGINFGGTQLWLTPRDMAKFGLLILADGRWGDEELVSPDWIAFMIRPQLADPSEYRQSYAAHWWYTLFDGYAPMAAAVGYGGQFILVAPELDTIIVVTASSTRGSSYISGAASAQQVEDILDYIELSVLPALQPEPAR
ncbi:MAG: serine hydrolase [Chloroflexi bacterium]|nr:serine hydrolase [Chloroflexota bacterium]